MAQRQAPAFRRMITFVITLFLAGAVLAGIYLFVSSPGEVRDQPPAGAGQQAP
ncbi:hypothetical protein [Rhizobium sp. 9140]|uniref:hypothetical protein n=1 Tax=Rhizobium sp. 9140 TaxID=1761900 RepID=UPI000791D880|nr:hypothetical protein [Rhizobium sp. 9140]CZT33660.1 hypothetical protein GA0004734_00006820 [Rhizobium sp. 9140]